MELYAASAASELPPATANLRKRSAVDPATGDGLILVSCLLSAFF